MPNSLLTLASTLFNVVQIMRNLLLWAICLVGFHSNVSWCKEGSHKRRGEDDITLLTFKNPVNTTVCSETTFEWSTLTNLGSMSLTVASNDRISKIATISMSVHSFSWNPVTVPGGWYILQASLSTTTVVVNSSAFFVDGGSDWACIAGGSLPSFYATAVPPLETDPSSLVKIIAPVRISILIGGVAPFPLADVDLMCFIEVDTN
ncbi:hypothetical protein IW261DRAFT_1568441 [Armillaria novae-zelandiae]|uniref:Uncharacterized protein n=1 Tax=Armillaria novae-zelandiae TaxID=153914 RepID=A0AA39P076_9AGAR|nr:hypothetical protein IW261DRAFT_1568441 [Armillaria novae-zelandiae]